MIDPMVTVLPHKRSSGWDSGGASMPRTKRSEVPPLFEVMPLSKAMTTHFETDTHLQPIMIDGDDSAVMPRVNLGAISHSGESFVQTAVFVDLDKIGHASWADRAMRARAYETLVSLFPDASWVYTTRAGARLVFVPNRPLPVADAAAWSRGLIYERVAPLVESSPEMGLQVDLTTTEPNRLFRAPRVVRDRVASDPDVWHNPDAYVVVEDIDPLGESSAIAPAPTDHEEVGYTVPPGDPLWTMAGLGPWSKSRTLPDEGRMGPGGVSPGRDVLVTRLAGRAMSCLLANDHEDPEGAAWSLLAPLVQRTIEAGSTVTLDKLWSKIEDYGWRDRTYTRAPSGKVIVRLTGDEATDAHHIAAVVAEAVNTDPHTALYRRGRHLVRTTPDLRGLEPVEGANLRLIIASAALIPTKEGTSYRMMPPALAESVGAVLAESEDLDQVSSVEQCPPITIDPPHMATAVGVHAGALYTNPDRVNYGTRPSMVAGEAVDLWRGLLSGYFDHRPGSGFKSDVDFAAYLAWAVGAAIRPNLRTLPLLVIDANRPGAGKTLLLDILATVFEGYRSGGRIPDGEGRWDLDLRTWALAGKRFMWFDNVSGRVGADALDRALTGDRISGRALHSTTHSGDVPFKCAIAVTSNNIEVVGDTQRRTLMTRLVRRSDFVPPATFDTSALLERTRAQRGALYSALATIATEYARKGRPTRPGMTRGALWGSFEDWDKHAAGAVAWATGVDPTAEREDIVAASDTAGGAIETIIALSAGLFGVDEGDAKHLWTAGELRRKATISPKLSDAISDLLDVSQVTMVSVPRLARALTKHSGATSDGHVLLREKRGRHSFFRVMREEDTKNTESR